MTFEEHWEKLLANSKAPEIWEGYKQTALMGYVWGQADKRDEALNSGWPLKCFEVPPQ